MMVKAGFDVTIYTTQAQADATRKVVEEGAGYDRIVCSGGDGTLDEVMTGLMQAKLHIPIGYIRPEVQTTLPILSNSEGGC